MQYILLVCHDSSFRPSDTLGPETEDWVTRMDGRGVRLQGDRFRPASEAKTVRIRDGELRLTEGPFARIEEKIAGYDLLECASMEEAIQVASEHPMAKLGAIEVRAIWRY